MIDTIQIAHNLQKAGIPQNQAEAIAQTILSVSQASGLVTKDDITKSRTETKDDVTSLRAETNDDIAKLRSEINLLKLMIGGIYALLVPILLKLFLR